MSSGRNGKITPYDDSKISVAMTKAFLAVEGGNAAASNRIHETIAKLTQQISHAFLRRMETTATIHIEDIQDQVELALMREGEQLVARKYVLYREERRKLRVQQESHATVDTGIKVILDDGSTIPLDQKRLNQIVNEACSDLDEVTADFILQDTLRNIYDGIPVAEINKALIMSARTLIEQEPNYSYVAARLLLDSLRSEALSFLDITTQATAEDMRGLYPQALATYIHKGIALERLDPALASFDLEKLGQALQPERDFKFSYLSLQTLYDRYFIHEQQLRYELPQVFFMRVAMGLALEEKSSVKNAPLNFTIYCRLLIL